MLLYEQWHKNSNRRYYHGSRIGATELRLSYDHSSCGIVFLTTDALYALRYTKFDGNPKSTVFKCKLKTPLNIFNANSKVDIVKLRKKMPLITDYQVKLLQQLDWAASGLNRFHLIDAVHDLGYDGYFSFERQQQDENHASVGLFDLSSVIIDDVVLAEDFALVDSRLDKYLKDSKVFEEICAENGKHWASDPEFKRRILREAHIKYENDEKLIKQFLIKGGYLRYSDE